MIVYANNFSLNANNGIKSVIKQIAIWTGKNNRTFVDPEILSQGIRELKFNSGSILSSLVTVNSEGEDLYPYYFCAKYQHADSIVRGRRWTTEIGINQESPEDEINVSFLLTTDEISTRVNETVQVTCPLIVRNINDNCNTVDRIPSHSIIYLTEENSPAFIYEIERQDRNYPLVVLSYNSDGRSFVSPSRLKQILIGLAQVIEIPKNENTFAIEQEIGRNYIAFGGAVNIIFPYKSSDSGGICRTNLLTSRKISDVIEQGISLDTEILSIITHYTNLPHSWKHTSTEKVRQRILQHKIKTGNFDQSSYDDLLDEAALNLEKAQDELASAQALVQEKEIEIEQANYQIEGLKISVASMPTSKGKKSKTTLSDYRDLIIDAINSDISLNDSLSLIENINPNRLIVLDSAFKSAKESDRGGFSHGGKALILLLKLSCQYYDLISSGKGDFEAKNVFGKKEFASKEAEILTQSGVNRRTFEYNGEKYFMEKHLKFGVKDSLAETLRIHFDWKSDERKIIIGHCGKHLDF